MHAACDDAFVVLKSARALPLHPPRAVPGRVQYREPLWSLRCS